MGISDFRVAKVIWIIVADMKIILALFVVAAAVLNVEGRSFGLRQGGGGSGGGGGGGGAGGAGDTGVY